MTAQIGIAIFDVLAIWLAQEEDLLRRRWARGLRTWRATA